jgi:hypothetical protein
MCWSSRTTGGGPVDLDQFTAGASGGRTGAAVLLEDPWIWISLPLEPLGDVLEQQYCTGARLGGRYEAALPPDDVYRRSPNCSVQCGKVSIARRLLLYTIQCIILNTKRVIPA